MFGAVIIYRKIDENVPKILTKILDMLQYSYEDTNICMLVNMKRGENAGKYRQYFR